jgi:cytochrome c oxidase subunit III
MAEIVAEQFATPEQQRETAFLGMWTFLATELMLFGGLFFGIAVYRLLYREAMREASAHLYKSLGGINTAVLLTSSLTMALAVGAARQGRRRDATIDLAITAALGLVFVGIKGTEYYLEYREGLMPGVGPPFPLHAPGAELFFNAYFFATGLHAVHLLIGVTIVGIVTARIAWGDLLLPGRQIVVEITGLYWHFVDIAWVFLYPAFYLIGGS